MDIPINRFSAAVRSSLDVSTKRCRAIPINVYGYSDYYCWFVESDAVAPVVSSVVLYYLPLWAFFIANTVMFARTYKKLKELEMEGYAASSIQANASLSSYPVRSCTFCDSASYCIA
jgi:hypothetical protein